MHRQQQAQESKAEVERKAKDWCGVVDSLFPVGNKHKRKKKKTSKDTSTSTKDPTDGIVEEPKQDSIRIMGALLSLPVTFPFIMAAKWRHSRLETRAEGILIILLTFIDVDMSYRS